MNPAENAMNRIISNVRRCLGALLLPIVLALPAFAADKPLPGEVKVIDVKEAMSPANAAFQACATGMPPGKAVAVGVDASISRTGMVKFDGLGPDDSLLIEAKGFGYKIDEKLGVWKEGYVSGRMQDKLRLQLDRQLKAAQSVGRSVQWVVPNEGIRKAFAELLNGRIPVKVALPRPDCPKSSDSSEGEAGGSF
ncbi:MAG: hypothetical protein IV110_07060 [Aquabacterium sp.]|uniref:Tox-REase-5 domain-containing protein n=2 Tax=Aquabacterium TaxID=92793 RepID=UPI001D482C6F|nr:Tox-REase-5 domain-containing protein [Aquabacterium sp.]MBT9609786.1 hypothetical protein [Aquabacterium sp.]|tara:strand:- start:737 stop:1318 length:582 start_codon:yes stop_codon:yes gene_type:complete